MRSQSRLSLQSISTRVRHPEHATQHLISDPIRQASGSPRASGPRQQTAGSTKVRSRGGAPGAAFFLSFAHGASRSASGSHHAAAAGATTQHTGAGLSTSWRQPSMHRFVTGASSNRIVGRPAAESASRAQQAWHSPGCLEHDAVRLAVRVCDRPMSGAETRADREQLPPPRAAL